MHIKFKNMNCRFIVTSKTGKYIAPYVTDSMKSENEVLFLDGTVFDVVSVKTANHSWLECGDECFIITMVEV